MKTYLAGGCFWCMAKPYDEIEGVKKVVSGYSGGDEVNPKYEDVKGQKTNHRETIMIEYDEKIVSFEEILKTYFYNIDPFDDGGQFIDRGHSYTCAIYYLNNIEKEIALNMIKKIEKDYGKKVFVSIEPFKTFYSAEEYHQDYHKRNEDEYHKEYEISGRTKRTESDKIKL